MRIRGLIAASLCMTVGCTLFTSFSGFTGGGPDASSEGGTNGDAATDGGGFADGGEGGVAETDSGGDGGGKYCATVDAAFCEDFDDPNDTTLKNWIRNVDPEGSVARVDGGFSAPFALETRAAVATNNNIAAHISRVWSNVKRSRLAYRFRIEEMDSSPRVKFGQIDLKAQSGALASLRLQVVNGQAYVEGAIYPTGSGQATYPNVTASFNITIGTWYAVDLSCNWEASPATVTFDLDGVRIAENTPVPGATFGPGQLTVHAGIYYLQGPSSGWRARVDDVAVWTE